MNDAVVQDNESVDNREYITAMIGRQLFGMPIDQVHDVFLPQNMTPVPQARSEVAGVLNLRGRIVTAIDMRRRLGLPPRTQDATPMAVGIEYRNESYGLIIDQVGEVMRIAQDSIEPSPANLDARWREISSGVCRLEGQLMVLLDVERILAITTEPAAA